VSAAVVGIPNLNAEHPNVVANQRRRNMKDHRSSFTSADALPVKLLQDHDLIQHVTNTGSIPPVHVQLIPTNRCNLKCTFCSCSEEDRSKEMSIHDMVECVRTLSGLGTKSLTITGGGEPLLYPFLDTLLNLAEASNMATGLVTNGLLLGDVSPETLKKLTWCRVSHGDDRQALDKEYETMLRSVVSCTPGVDWAFSYVLSETPNVMQLMDIILLGQELGFTHIRVVADLLQPDSVPMAETMETLKDFLAYTSIPVIFQGRDEPEHGQDCRICYLKPVVAPDLKVYACCGVQYALEKPSLSLPEELCLGTLEDLAARVKIVNQKPFPGAKHCVRCYYGAYNRVLGALVSDTVHKEFI